jgi:hypothetical protein
MTLVLLHMQHAHALSTVDARVLQSLGTAQKCARRLRIDDRQQILAVYQQHSASSS